MKKNQKKALKIIVIIILIIIGWIVITGVVYNINQISDIQLKEKYKEREEKVKLLNQVPDKCVIEGEKIAFDKIQNDNVKYSISNDKDKIILNYWIEHEKYVKPSDNEYSGKITLTKDYKIIDKEIKIESITFDIYKEDIERIIRWMSVCISGEILLGITFVIYMIFLIKKKAKGQA